MADDGEQDELVTRASRGDRVAIDRLLEQHLPGLRAFIRLRLGGHLKARESSQDLAQSVCREILTHLDRYQHGSEAGFRHWLYATALRKIKNRGEYHRAAKRDAGREAAGMDEDAVVAMYRSFCTPSRAVIAREQLEAASRAFAHLSDEHREVILLDRVLGFSRPEIAKQMGRSEAAIRTLIYRALSALSKRMLEEG